MFTAKRVVFSGKDFFLAPSLPKNFHLHIFVYVVITLEIAALVVVLVTDVPAKCASKICKSSTLQYFHTNCH